MLPSRLESLAGSNIHWTVNDRDPEFAYTGLIVSYPAPRGHAVQRNNACADCVSTTPSGEDHMLT